MVKQITQDPNNISISKINAFITKLFIKFIQIHIWLYLKRVIQDLSPICVCLFEKNTNNSHLLIQTCRIISRCWSKQRTARRGTFLMGAILLFTPPSVDPEESQAKFLHKNKGFSRGRIFSSPTRTRLSGSQTGSSGMYKIVIASHH